MIVVDSSALVAILEEEPGFDVLQAALERATGARISAVSFLETCMVVCARRGEEGIEDVSELLRAAEIVIEPFTDEDAASAVNAFLVYGKGRHPACQTAFKVDPQRRPKLTPFSPRFRAAMRGAMA